MLFKVLVSISITRSWEWEPLLPPDPRRDPVSLISGPRAGVVALALAVRAIV